MSRIYVDRISPYQSGSIQIDGYDPTIDTGSLATTGSNTFNGNQDIQGTLNVSGITTVGDDVKQSTGVSGNAAYIQNPDYFTQFYGSTLLWRPNTQGGQTFFWINEKSKAEIQINAWSSSYDNVIIPYADGNGTYIADWDGSYTITPWITIEKQQTPVFNRGVNVDVAAKLTPQDPLPSGELGMLAVSGSDLYFHNGTNWIVK